MHPVWQVLLERRARGDRADPHRVVLAIEGGGSRATFSGGMVLGLEECGFSGLFDAVYGASAGALNGAWFVAGDAARGVPAWYGPGVMRRVTGIATVLVGRPVVDMRWVVDDLYSTVVPLEWERILDAAVPLHPLATDADTGATVDLHHSITDVVELKTALRASTHLPVLGGPPVELGGRRLLDAALAETLPFRTPLAHGATHVLLLCTRRSDDVLRPPPRSGDLLARGLLAATAPGAARAWPTRFARQRCDETWLAGGQDMVLAVRPPAGSPNVAQRATDEHLLRTAVEAGRRAIHAVIPPVDDPAGR